jgi:hypothetical protein
MKKIIKYLGYATLFSGLVFALALITKLWIKVFCESSLVQIIGYIFATVFLLFLIFTMGLLVWLLLESLVGDPKSNTYKAAEKIDKSLNEKK